MDSIITLDGAFIINFSYSSYPFAIVKDVLNRVHQITRSLGLLSRDSFGQIISVLSHDHDTEYLSARAELQFSNLASRKHE